MLCIVLHTQSAYDKTRLRDGRDLQSQGSVSMKPSSLSDLGQIRLDPSERLTFSSVMQAGMGPGQELTSPGCRQEQSFHKHHLKSLSSSTAEWVGINAFTLLKRKLRLREVCDSSKVTQLG